VALAQWSIPPEQVGRLTLADFAQLTDAIDAENRSRPQQAAHEGR
jgi:hypothetical protein